MIGALPIRVLLIDMPQMMREIIRRTLARDSRFLIVGEYTEHVAIDVAVNRSGADYVIMGSGVFESRAVRRRLLEEGPQIRVLAVGADGARTTLYRLRPEEVELGEISLERLGSLLAGDVSSVAVGP
jgi:DNA-binding NarL/FixJ family response regulator